MTKSKTLIVAFAFNPNSYHLSAFDMFWSQFGCSAWLCASKILKHWSLWKYLHYLFFLRAIIHFERNLHYVNMHSCLDSSFQNVFPPFFYKRPLLDGSQLHVAVSKTSLNHHFPLSILFKLWHGYMFLVITNCTWWTNTHYYLIQPSLYLGGGFTHTKTLVSTFFLTENTAWETPTVRDFFVNKKKELYKKGATTMSKATRGSFKPEEG